MIRGGGDVCDVPLGLLRRSCRREAVAHCVYCGRPFCADHGERGPDYHDACSRKACRAKMRDVTRHLEWKQRVYVSNQVSVCAREGCEDRMRHRCSRCQLMFCDQHVEESRVAVGRGAAVVQQRALVCDHCRGRRKLWS